MSGLLIDGQLVPVPGVTVIPPAVAGGPPWAQLDPADYRSRPTSWVRQIIIHTTKGTWPQYVRAGAGPGGADKAVAEFWRHDPIHSAAQIVVDTDGSVVCLCDLARVMAYHAEASNTWSVGIEMYQLSDGGVYDATLTATVALVQTLCGSLGIPEQMPRGPYRNQPLLRMETGERAARRNLGGPSCVGVFGHRDNTGNRGRGDPGDEIFSRLAARGVEGLDYNGEEDLILGRARQAILNAADAKAGHTLRPLTVDGVCGPASIKAMRRLGYSRWRDVL
jgi:N-acetylmuramoyl-L-alanine amidase